jgi:hypothetical protein
MASVKDTNKIAALEDRIQRLEGYILRGQTGWDNPESHTDEILAGETLQEEIRATVKEAVYIEGSLSIAVCRD